MREQNAKRFYERLESLLLHLQRDRGITGEFYFMLPSGLLQLAADTDLHMRGKAKLGCSADLKIDRCTFNINGSTVHVVEKP